MKFRIKTTEFTATVSKMGNQRIINVPAAVQGIEPGVRVQVKKIAVKSSTPHGKNENSEAGAGKK